MTARLALTLLEVLKSQDAPTEVLEDENPSHTMPRRLGLSGVVERQIQLYRDEARRGGRITDAQLFDLVRLVVRRPDSEEVFREAGRRMAGGSDIGAAGPRFWTRLLPAPAVHALLRRRVRRGLKKVFGRRLGGFAPGPFALEGRGLLFIRHDPGGDACHFVTGYCQAVLEQALGGETRIVHGQCEGRQDTICRWTLTADARVRETSVERGYGSDYGAEPSPG